MNRIDKDTLAEIEFQVKWDSNEAEHTDTSLHLVNFWRDMLPGALYEELMGAASGDRIAVRFAPGNGVSDYNPQNRHHLKRRQFNEEMAEPRYGRFYPKGVLRDLYNVFPQNVQPVRCVGANPDEVAVDLNHPLAGREIEVTAVVHDIFDKPFDRGGKCKEMLETITEGPGMQARYNGEPTDFLAPDAFVRGDETHDARFYEKPRLVNHIDDRAVATISGLYGQILSPEMRVLDLMSSWRSHVPEAVMPRKLVGLGMNAEELKENPQLTEHVVHDLNAKPKLPFDDASFDRVICTVSVEYMTQPVAVFDEIARVLKPDGILMHTFSNRWFPPKAIKLWTELHEFERMGLVLEYFHQSGKFKNLNTFSTRGWDRPETDKYYPDMPQADPVFAVWGRKAA
ncbi:MAG TPA: methyltransferase domain-containing protein [Desulfosalsimonadaceae bacterium]|nr:methyltransferase domain-containing protein [Desulfosalsimonadaceae bacterium]